MLGLPAASAHPANEKSTIPAAKASKGWRGDSAEPPKPTDEVPPAELAAPPEENEPEGGEESTSTEDGKQGEA